MANNPLFDRVKMSVSGTPGTGDITLGAAADTYASFAEAGVSDGDIVSYLITQDGAAEIGKGTYTASGTSLSRDTVVWSSAGGTTKINVTSAAYVFITALSQDIVQIDTLGRATIYKDNNLQGVIRYLASRGTVLSPTDVEEGDTVGAWDFLAYKDYYFPCAAIAATIDGPVSYNVVPTALRFGVAHLDGGSWTEAARISSRQYLGLGTDDPTARLDINDDTLRLRTSKTPSSATATGNAGDICWDSNYVYVCVDTDTWKRAALSTW